MTVTLDLTDYPREAVIDILDKAVARGDVEMVEAIAEALILTQRWRPLPHQIPPDLDEDWVTWLLFGGRGTGKTDASAAFVTEHVRGPACDPRLPGGHRMAIIAPTLGDAIESCVNGPSGLKAHDPTCKLKGGGGGSTVHWPSGAEARLFGAYTPDDVERLRAGGNRCLVWVEELAAWRQLDGAWDNMTFGLRLGARPRIIGSTTPKPRKLLKEIVADPTTVVSHGRTSDNPHLDARVRARLEARYGGTRLGRQELEGEILDDVEGALWNREWIEEQRVTPADFELAVSKSGLVKIVVAVDPAVTATEDSDETGIIVAGRSKPRNCPICGPVTAAHAFVLADRTCKLSPDGWAKRAVAAYEEFDGDRMVAEVNQGGDLVETTIRNVAPSISYAKVHAKRGKALRAQPVAAVYEQRRVHHVGQFPELEDQQCTWDPLSGDDSPDRLDADVYALIELGMTFSGPVTTSSKSKTGKQLPKVPVVKPSGSPFPRVGFGRSAK